MAASIVLAGAFVALSGCSENEPSRSTVGAESVGAESAAVPPPFWPRLSMATQLDPAMEQAITDMMENMTAAQKVAQMIQPEIRDITVDDMRKYGFGSYLNGGGAFPNNDKHASPADWIQLAEDMYQASVDDSQDGSAIPTMWGTDAVHGHNNVIGATLFPHNIGLGAANNPELIEKIASVTAREVMVTGIDWVFAPTVAVVRDDRWGRTYEGYSESPEIVKAYASAIIKGLQGTVGDDFLGDEQVIGTVKHFLGDGGTIDGDDQGNNIASEQELFDIHAQGYVGGLSAGAQTVMASFNSWHGVKNHGNKYLLTDVLKDRMGFDGLVVGDWNGHGQIKGCTNESCSQATNAGLDIIMVPTAAWKPLYENTLAQLASGEISVERVDDAVRRILRVKMRAGLFDKPSPANRVLSGRQELIGSKAHREIALQAVRESLVLFKNNQDLLPLSPGQRVLVAGDGADNIGKQSGGWTITWQGTGNNNNDFPGGSSIYAGIEKAVSSAGGSAILSPDGSYEQKPDVAIVVFGEEPYAEGNGDLNDLEYQRGNKKDLALLRKLQAQGVKVVSVFLTGRPLWINPELNASDAFVVAWLPGSEGRGVADVLFRDAQGQVQHDFKGELSFSWPASPDQVSVNRDDANYNPLLPYGFGLQYGDEDVLAEQLSEIKPKSSEGLEPLVLFNSSVAAPWELRIGTEGQQQSVISSFQRNQAVSIKNIDKVVQEDARKVSFNGASLGSFGISSDFPSDLHSYFESDSALALTIKLEGLPSGAVFVDMNCGTNCSARVDLSKTLAILPDNQWQDISIDLACFDIKGADRGQIFSPITWSTKGSSIVNFSTISIVPDSAPAATLRCQS